MRGEGRDGDYHVDGGMRLDVLELFVQEWIGGLWVLVVLESGVVYVVVVGYGWSGLCQGWGAAGAALAVGLDIQGSWWVLVPGNIQTRVRCVCILVFLIKIIWYGFG
jgi:hypothetical protein